MIIFEYILYILSACFILLGIMILNAYSQTKSKGYFWAAVSYVLGGVLAIRFKSWLPLVIFYVLVRIIRRRFGDPLGSKTTSSVQSLSYLLGRRYLDENLSSNYEDFSSDMDTQHKALKELIDYIESDEQLKPILDKYGATRETVEALYYQLIKLGAGQWVKEYWVPGTAISNSYTLNYLLEYFNDNNMPINTDEARLRAGRVIVFFEYDELFPENDSR